MITPTASVIMNCLNGERFVETAIRSVYAQTFQDWEIVFLDNGSTDRTPEICRSFDSRLQYSRNDATVPLGTARNQALSKARGEFIAFLDADDLWFPEKLDAQVPLFARSEVGLVFSDTILRYETSGAEITYFRRNGYRPPRGKIFGAMLAHYSIPMLTAVFRRSVLDGMEHWFDPNFRVCDDYDFFMRLIMNWECDFVDKPLTSCLIRPDSIMVKHQKLAPAEMTRTLEKLRALGAPLDTTYTAETEANMRLINYRQARADWQAGDGAASRRHLAPHLPDPKFLASYLASFIPFQWVKKLYWLWWR